MFALQVKLDADKLKDQAKKDDAAEKTEKKAAKAKSSKTSKS